MVVKLLLEGLGVSLLIVDALDGIHREFLVLEGFQGMEGFSGVEELHDFHLVVSLFLRGGESPVVNGLVGLNLEEVALLAQLA